MMKILFGLALVGVVLALGSPAPDAGSFALVVGMVGVARCARRRKAYRGRLML